MKEGGFNKLQKRVRGRFSDMVWYFLLFLLLLFGLDGMEMVVHGTGVRGERS